MTTVSPMGMGTALGAAGCWVISGEVTVSGPPDFE
jgi:hypothetical protein